jgi:two-component system cell cycle response regulator DivK
MCNVLLVEDNRDNREIYRTILEYGGHVVVEAVNGAEALPLARDGQPDVIVMDVSMPVMGGLEATKRLKDDSATRGIPIIILSAHALSGDLWSGMEAGADAYLTKPCEPRKVLAEVERLHLVRQPSRCAAR